MTQTIVTIAKKVACAGLVAACLYSPKATAQPLNCPDAAWLATATPVYYEGRSDYWYGDHWCWWDGSSWGYYGVEPLFLSQYRGRAGWGGGGRRFYEGHPSARGGAVFRGGGGGGARGGGGGRR